MKRTLYQILGVGMPRPRRRSRRCAHSRRRFAFTIEHLDAQRMVLNIGSAGQRLACERR